MKIVIDAYQASAHITGTDRLAYNVLRELQLQSKENQYIVLVNPRYDYIKASVTATNFSVLPVRLKKRALWLMFRLPLLLLRLKADVFYSFHNFGGPGIKVCHTVGSILDTIPFSRPELYFDKDSALRKFIVLTTFRRAIKNVDAFVAISEYTKQQAVKDAGIPKDKITVMHLQADPAFFAEHSRQRMSEVKAKYNLPDQYIFTIGASEPRKNVASVIKAHSRLSEGLQKQYPLMIAGAKWHDREIDLSNYPHIRLTGFVDDADLPIVYSLATAFIFLSTYEGFGLPVLEAMASKTPVITSTATSLPEVAGEAAILVDPMDIEAATAALQTVLTSKEKRQELIALGERRVVTFSWATAAKLLMGALGINAH